MRALGLIKPCVGVLHLVSVAWALLIGGFAAAEDARPGPADRARALAEAVSSEPGAELLDAWSKAVIDRALGQAVGTAAPSGFPHHAVASEAKGSATAEVLLFTSLSVPAASWRASARDAARIGAPLVLRGVARGKPSRDRAADRRSARERRWPGSPSIPGSSVCSGSSGCRRSSWCRAGCRPAGAAGARKTRRRPFDRVTGNLSLAAALEAVAAEGDVGRVGRPTVPGDTQGHEHLDS